MRFTMPKKQPDFITQMEMREVERAISDKLALQKHKEIAKKISKFIGDRK